MPQGLVARCLHWQTGIPYVIHNHSSDLTVFSRFGAVGRAVACSIVRECRAIFFVNRKQMDYALSLFRTDDQIAIKRKVSTLPMGVNFDSVPACRELFDEYPLSNWHDFEAEQEEGNSST